jgi:hypothetical protein
MTWHMTALDIQTWPRGEVPGLGLTDEDVGLLRGVDCDILAPGMGCPGPRLNRINTTYVTPGFRRQTECEPCTCQDQLFTYTAVT